MPRPPLTWLQAVGGDKMLNWGRAIKQYGGVGGYLKQIWITDQAKPGTCIGIDQFGNRYMENNAYPLPRNRWVNYSRRQYLEYDASQVPPEWHRWLHHSTDETPMTAPHEQHRWLLQHEENTSSQFENKSNTFYPYSTTRPKIHDWQPKSSTRN